MRKLAIAYVGCAILAGSLPAHAAERTDWSGFYLGVNAGAGWGESKFRSMNDVPLFPTFTYQDTAVPASNGTVAKTKGSDTNALGGGQFGFNWQSGNIIFGAEADYDGTGLRQSAVARATPTGGSSNPHSFFQTVNAKYFADTNWMGSLRGRFGFKQDFLMVYATGGAAFAHVRLDTSFVEVNAASIGGAVSNLSTKDSKLQAGWTAGAGGEWAINNAWSVAAEYRFSNFGYQTYDAGIAHAAFASSPRLSSKMKLTVDQVTIRLNYRIGA
jgi:outer membrane immunogenic protein